MASNERVLLDEILKQRQEDSQTPLPSDEAFEIFSCEQILRDLDFSADEIAAGVVGGGDDGGLDGVYAILGDNLLAEDSEVFDEDFSPSKVAVGTRLLLWLVQAKREESFTETALDLASSSAERLLDLTQTEEDLRDLYSDALVERVGLFRLALQRLATRHPTLEVRFSYATRGSTDGIHAKVKVKGKSLEEKLQKLLPGAIGRVEFLGASELWERASTRPTYTLELTYEENATSGTSHVALVSLRDYLSFISDESGTIRRHIFDWNVRDYEGDVEVNREMGESLRTDDAPQFWWLNNGVTIICSTTSIVGKKYVLDDVQIVNGLQTSYTIHRVLHDADATHPALDHLLLVRILVTEDPVTRDRVIRATNSQTKVSAASLRATDNIQRRIEAFFLSQGWFYDQRKNYYRNIGKTPDRIVGIPLLAQAVMAVGLSRPDDSRARPSSLIKRDEDYEEIFSGKTDLAVYLWAAKAQKNVDAFLLSDQAKTTRPERTNLRFHLAMLATAKLFGGRVHAPVQLANLAQSEQRLSDTDLPASLSELRSYYDEFAEGGADSLDKIAKGSDFVDFVLGKAFP